MPVAPPADLVYRLLRDRWSGNRWPWYTAAYDLNVCGVRGASDEADLWDDAIVVAYVDERGEQRAERFQATTDPGRPWLEQPMRPEGCAVVAEGYYPRVWSPGLHGSPGYSALVQTGPIGVRRDPDRDRLVRHAGPVVPGLYGINLHHGGDTRGGVGRYSAGCQVVRARASLERILWLVGQQRAHGHGSTVSYGLADVDLAPELAAVLADLPA